MAKRMRPASRNTGCDKLRRLRCFSEVYERLLAGWSMGELARFIQQDRNEYTDVTHSSLMTVLERFRSSIPPAQLMEKRIPEAMHKAAAEVEEGLDELKEMEKLYRMQMERIEIDRVNEKSASRLKPTMTQEIRVARELLSAIADLKMDLGLNGPRNLGEMTVSVDVARYGKASVQQVMDDPERRRKVLNVAERMLALPARTERATVIDVPNDLSEDEELAALEIEADVLLGSGGGVPS